MLLQVSFQISAVLRPDPSFPILDSIQGTRLVPLFWATEGFTEVRSLELAIQMTLMLPMTMMLPMSYDNDRANANVSTTDNDDDADNDFK